MVSLDNIISLLKEREKENLSLIYLIEDKMYNSIEHIGNSILLRRKNHRNSVYLYSPNETSFTKDILPNIKDTDKHFSAIYKWMADIIVERKEVKGINPGFKLVLPNSISLGIPKIKPRPLTIHDAEIVDRYWEYRSEQSLEYIKHLIKERICEGIDVDGKLVAWALTHDDGSLGMIYVLDDYRRHGYAKDITISMVEKTRGIGRYPFVHIIKNNKKSLNLAQGLGFKKVSSVVWMALS
jgi:8-oxo-dGTP diphosphatase